jgi:periplasmic protein CpxP/Spy
MKSRTITLGLALVAALLAAGGHASAQNTNDPQAPPSGRPGGRFGRPGGPGGPLGGLMLGRLNLTDAQRDQVKSLMQSHQSDMKALGDRAAAARAALQSAISADVVDEGLIRARSADLAAVEADMAVAQARLRSEIFQILTPDQQAQAKQAQADMQQRMQGMRGSRRPPQ